MADNLQVSAKVSDEKSVNILTLSVVRRDGAITPFKSDKISNAIKKAFLAQTKIRNDKNKEKEQQDGQKILITACETMACRNGVEGRR